VVDSWVSFFRLSPLKSLQLLPSPGPSSEPFFLKLFSEAHDSISVASTEKCWSLIQRLAFANQTTSAKNMSATLCCNSRAWFWEKIE